MKRWFPPFALFALLALQLAPLAAARAELPPLIPRDLLFGNPEKASPRISPDGKRLAYLKADAKDVLQVWVKTIGQDDDKQISQDRKRGIRQYGWSWDNENLYYLQDNDGDENFHVYLCNPKSGETRDMTPFFGVRAAPVAQEPERPDEAILVLNRRSKSLFEPWHLDLKTGALTLAAENPGNVGGWLTDADLKVRGAIFLKPEGGAEFKVRDTESGEWRLLASWGVDDEFEPHQFSRDGKTIYVTTNLGTDTQALYVMDAATGKLTPIASDPRADAGEVLFHPTTREPQAISFDRDRRRWQVIDKSVEADFAALAKVEPGDFTLSNRDLSDQIWLVAFTNDTKAVHYYSWDRKAQKASFMFSAWPELEKYALAPVKPVEIKSRDGLQLPCYLTLPVGIAAKNLPTVLYVHGGPWARDHWGYDPNAQWLANRGYAVLQVNYRGSTGFGKKFKNAAKREFAGKMHDDLIDAVNWSVKQGIADKKRVGIMGGSYGGYATLVGLSFTPDVFACGIDIVGPSSLVTLIESFPPYWGPFLSQTWYPFCGNPKDDKDRADLLARSPITKVDQIKAPLLVGQGANDPRVTQKESDVMVEALKKRGVPVEYIVFPDEGHGFQRPENRIKFWTACEAFLAKHLGGRAEPPSTQSSENLAQPAGASGGVGTR